MTGLASNPLFTRLESSESVIVAGAGGGFDLLAGIPLALALRSQGKRVTLANLSFAELATLPADAWIAEGVARIVPETIEPQGYFPDHVMAQWLAEFGWETPVHAFPNVGVVPLTAAYRELAALVKADAVVLVDGGTDILMTGDESGLGTPEEDVASLAAVDALDVATKVVVSLGFGIDAFHGVDHTQVLENIAALDRDGGYLGAFSLPRATTEAQAYVDAVRFCARRTPSRPSIVNGQIAAAVEGEFGNVQFSERTFGSELFVNPLMALYFCFEHGAIARRNLYLSRLSSTVTRTDVSREIELFRDSLEKTRSRRTFPH